MGDYFSVCVCVCVRRHVAECACPLFLAPRLGPVSLSIIIILDILNRGVGIEQNIIPYI
jgi:hypothetical protein